MEDTEMKELYLDRMRLYLLPFSSSLQLENKDLLNNKRLKAKLLSYDFKKSVLIFSRHQLFSVVSIIILTSEYDRQKNKFMILRSGDLLDMWFNDTFTMSRTQILSIPVLILHMPQSGYTSEKQAAAKHGILNEILRYRQIAGKATWVFYEGIEDTFIKEYGNIDDGIVIQKIELSQYN